MWKLYIIWAVMIHDFSFYNISQDSLADIEWVEIAYKYACTHPSITRILNCLQNNTVMITTRVRDLILADMADSEMGTLPYTDAIDIVSLSDNQVICKNKNSIAPVFPSFIVVSEECKPRIKIFKTEIWPELDL
jgi:hypothetical protein